MKAGEAKERAKGILKHYLYNLPWQEGVRRDPDCVAEIDRFVELVVDAAVQTAVEEFKNLERFKAVTATPTESDGLSRGEERGGGADKLCGGDGA